MVHDHIQLEMEPYPDLGEKLNYNTIQAKAVSQPMIREYLQQNNTDNVPHIFSNSWFDSLSLDGN